MPNLSFEEAQDYYNRTREQARTHHLSSQNALDKMLLYLVTGVFVLSVNVVFNTNLHFDFTSLLFISWILLSISIVSQIIGYLLSTWQSEDQILSLDKWYADISPMDRMFMNSSSIVGFIPPRKYGKSITRTNYITISTFIFALVSILIFSAINFNNMNGEPKNLTQLSPEHKGSENLLSPYVPSRPQLSEVVQSEPTSASDGAPESKVEEEKK